MFHSNISEPTIEIEHLSKLYYMNETFSFDIRVHGYGSLYSEFRIAGSMENCQWRKKTMAKRRSS